MPQDEPLYALGVDENGLGPRLGPLIVTSILARTSQAGSRVAHSRPKGALRARLGDSKELVAYGDSALGEAWARAILLAQGKAANTPDELVAELALDPREVRVAPCPSAHERQCWGTAGEAFAAEDALVRKVSRDLVRLRDAGVEIVRPRVAIVCAKRLNEATDAGRSRFQVDLHTMERLVLAAREDAGTELVATCGKVGGFDRYETQFGPLAGRLFTTLQEGRKESVYRVAGVGTVAFVRDADATNLLVCMSSLVGKWVRDLMMGRIVRYHREHDPELPDASGYHDPVTARFVSATKLARKKRSVPDTCFERRRLGDDAISSELPKTKAQASEPKSPKPRAKTKASPQKPRSASP